MRRIEQDDLRHPAVIALIEEHLRNMYELSPPESVFAFNVEKLRAPEVTFWTAWDGDTLLGCVALKALSPEAGELKSMRTPSHLRRTGAGRQLLQHVLTVAHQRGYRALYLETGNHPAFLPAQALYESVGFTACGPFADYLPNDFSVFMSLSLTSANQPP